MNAIETKQLTKKYKDLTAVNALDLEVREGELFALLGVNGAGKTTTIKMLSCLTKPTSGDAVLLGRSITSEPDEVKKLLAVSPQDTAVAPKLTVKENLEMLAAIADCDKREAAARIERLSRELGLSEVMHKAAGKLSGGWQRRLSIAMGLITEPKILFLDEPTLGLDVLARRELWQVVEGLRGHITIVLTTHYLEEAEALSDRIGVMAGGRLKALGTAKELIARTGAASFEDAFVELAAGKGAIA